MTVRDIICVMDSHYNNIMVRNYNEYSPYYAPFVGTVDEFVDSELYAKVGDAEVLALYADDDGTIRIYYFYASSEESVDYVIDENETHLA